MTGSSLTTLLAKTFWLEKANMAIAKNSGGAMYMAYIEDLVSLTS